MCPNSSSPFAPVYTGLRATPPTQAGPENRQELYPQAHFRQPRYFRSCDFCRDRTARFPLSHMKIPQVREIFIHRNI